jgi:hypothetical protein
MESVVILGNAQEAVSVAFTKLPDGPEFKTKADFKGRKTLLDSDISEIWDSEESDPSDDPMKQNEPERPPGAGDTIKQDPPKGPPGANDTKEQDPPKGPPGADEAGKLDPNEYPYPHLDPDLKALICECRAVDKSQLPDLTNLYNRVYNAVTDRDALWYADKPGGKDRETDESIEAMIHTILFISPQPDDGVPTDPDTQPRDSLKETQPDK